MNKTNTRSVNLKLPEDIYLVLLEMAKNNTRSVSAQVHHFVKAGILLENGGSKATFNVNG
jgi:hypothetical protein